MTDTSNVTPNASTTRVNLQTLAGRSGRSGSILHRPSTATRQPSNSSIVSSNSSSTDATTASAAARNRRQNAHPPLSHSSTSVVAKPARKAVATGAFADSDAAVTRAGSKRRPGLASERSADSNKAAATDSGSEMASNGNASRSSKMAKSSSRASPMQSQTSLASASASALSLDQSRIASVHKSPRTGVKPTTPSAGRRQSMAPGGHASHATGLGARTISPTDTRRLKRMSMMTQKSYSSGLSGGSTVSFNTHTPVHNPLPSEDDEDVPPVPAIPKAFESPRDSGGETSSVDKKKSVLSQLESISSHNSSTASIATTAHHTEAIGPQRKPSARKSCATKSAAAEDGQTNPPNKKTLEPLRLPPLNLAPLSVPTSAKVVALKDQTAERNMSPPPSRQLPKTPTTPLTASKSSFFSKVGYDESIEMPSLRNLVGKSMMKNDHHPVPRIPASATLSCLNNGNPEHTSTVSISQSGSFLDARRRKSSNASLTNLVPHDRTKNDAWAAKKEPTVDATIPLPSTRSASVVHRLIRPKSSGTTLQNASSYSASKLDNLDELANEEMRKLGLGRKETEIAARTLDALKKRATPKERVSSQDAFRIAMLNIYERGEIIDYNDVYFCGTQNARKVVGDLQSDLPNFGYDDERGDYAIVIGDHIAYRYEIVDVLGKGSFGQVVRCIDHKTGSLVAVKIIRNKKRFHQQALVEVKILEKLHEWDPKHKHSMVKFTESFYFRGHLCISTELLDMNLYEFIKAHSFRGFSLRIIRRFTKQILSSLILLKQHKVIHCDLKPENILLRHPLHSEIKVIDFGSSCFESEKVYTYIQSRFYRSPEVILGMTYGLPIDMWSVGCILAELYTGVPIFPGENEQEQLACIMEVFGPPEKHLIEKSTRKKLFFDSMGKPRLTVSSKGRRRRPSSKTLQQVLKCDDEVFIDFLARCLRWDPERRLRPEDAIRHEFITGIKAPPIRDSSPIKRHHTISVPRPLPDPPGGVNGKSSAFSSIRSGNSPHKPFSGSSRRVSGVTAATTASMNRRTSAGPAAALSGGGSGLPRAAGRITSGRHDIATAGANAAMTRRA
ncbi:Dual specificity protein kinase pom1 [Escovopsis weberi]|uniref:Dual specificity protein kinase pom1 n=1 Tax=Escovopsis weberi TaxID=150374 RepID=A0A0M8N7J4_ESCWE|nr:Dual specificity protein kinase pom1 [Escovopsis weberi]